MRYKQLKNQQQGLVSILVTMIFLIVLSLIVIGFAQIARREQRQALDRQLSNQAFYAAESGINAAKELINGTGSVYSKYNPEPADKPDCQSDAPLFNPELDGGNVKYTCLLIDQRPKVLEWASINPSKSTVVPIKAYKDDGSPTVFSEIELQWQNPIDSGNPFTSGSDFPPFSSWTAPAPVLRIDLTPSGGAMNRTDLLNNTGTVFLRPTTTSESGAVDSYNFSNAVGQNRGAVVKTQCDETSTDTKKCKITLTNLGGFEYLLRVKPEYSNAEMSMSATVVDGAGNRIAVNIGGAQAEIDSTGKASDVLKRIRVKIPYNNNNYDYPEGVTESGDTICKRLKVVPPSSGSTTTECSATGSIPDVDTTNPITVPPVVTGAGDAEFQSCLGDECGSGTGGPAPPAYRWKYTVYNTSTNPDNIVASCRWSWGDGSPDKVGTPSNSKDACLEGQWISHSYPKLQSPLVCRKYTVTLTVNFKNSYAPKTYTSLRYVPNGTEGAKPKPAGCGGVYPSYTP